MSKKNRIDIYMGIVGQKYVDKETALKTLNAAKKNVLDVKYILYLIDRSYMEEFAILHSKDYPLAAPNYKELYDTVKGNAEQAQTVARQIRETLEAAIVNNSDNEYRVNKLQALLDVLKENDIDNDFSNGGNTTTADANVEIVNALKAELDDIKAIALELLATNEQRVIECEQLYADALEEFKSYLPEEYETPEEASDRIEEELHRRLRVLRNNLEEVQATTDAINEVSENVQTAMNDILNATTPDSEDSTDDIVQKVDSADINATLDGAVHAGDLKSPAEEAQPAIYSFESWNNAAKEVKYGEGTVKVIEMRAGGATVEVVTNSTDQSFVGQQFNVATGLATDEPIQLHTLENVAVDIWVTVTLVSEAVEAKEAEYYDEASAAEYNASLPGAVSEEVVMINADAEKPTTANPAPMDMTELTGTTEMNLIYPLNWERIENGQIVSPVIKDWNGIGVAFESIGEITIDEVQYRVTNIALGSGNYTIEFV